MVLADGQIQIRDLVLGRGTQYKVRKFNPWTRTVRADQTGEMPWGDGSWSGAEWFESVAINMDVVIEGTDLADWQVLHQALDLAFSPIGAGTSEVELSWCLGAQEQVMFGRPRGVSPTPDHVRVGRTPTTCMFWCGDPFRYSAALNSVSIGLPEWSGGLVVPVTVPVTIPQTQVDGLAEAVSAGAYPAPLLLRIDGPVVNPSITVVSPAGVPLALSLELSIEAGQWIDINTQEQSVLLNGFVSRLRDAYGDWPLLEPGTSEIRWRSDVYDPTAQLTVSWRDRF